ncbi:ChrR family anti-sigma-E factor [Chthonobacter albigriseus]|uniref:ChrR family anti-sigma-E factor n=1 Tax=Chthonobacter albigriseus TaxID=1683161 RepID=UPI0015EE8948|nr:ChrR family anti-sigma-E factor [Chthonobacter albigriseus]
MAPNLDQEINSLLAGYAMGGLPAPLSVLVAAHLELSPRNRRFVSDMESLAGRAIETVEPAAVRDRDAKLAAIFGDAPSPAASAVETASASRRIQLPRTGRLPLAIRRFVGNDAANLPWKTVLPGVREYKIGEFDGLKTELFWIRAGTAMPAHTHEGGEITLVCEGGFTDILGSYDRGDISITDSSVDHKPVADDDGDCICFAVTDAPLRLTGFFGRLFNPFIRG